MTATAEKESCLTLKTLTFLGLGSFPGLIALLRKLRAQDVPKNWDGVTSSHIDFLIRGGLSVEALDSLYSYLDIQREMLEELLGTSRRTLQRARKEHRRLSPVESDRAYRLASIFALASEVFEGEDAARSWLKTPLIGLGGKAPYDLIHTEVGTKEVIDLLKRIEYGVPV